MDTREGPLMESTAQPRSGVRLPRPSIVFPVCVITVALSAISPAFGLARRDVVASASSHAVRLSPGERSVEFDDAEQVPALGECLASDIDWTE